MCGIIGIKGELPSLEIFQAARDVMEHRGPDDSGVFYYPKDKIAIGHRRLSIIDLSTSGKQPFWSNDDRFVITFNGEIYNYLEIKKEIGDRYIFKSKTDTEVLLAAYIIWGDKMLEKLNGMFAFAIWDRETNVLFCARDRLGEKPFYYTKTDSVLCFASEIKALLALGAHRKPNEKIIFDYLFYGFYDHTDETFFEGIKKLPAGHYLIFKSGDISIKKYWDLADAKPLVSEKLSDSEVIEKFKLLIADSIKIRYRSDVPVGLNLSSGLDSNSLYQYSNIVNGYYPDIFTMCLPGAEYNECEILDEYLTPVQKKTWSIVTLKPEDVFPIAEKMNGIQDEPYGGIPTIAYDKLIEKAKKQGVTVLLEGQGLDEILAGYKYYESYHALDTSDSVDISKVSEQTMLSQDMTKQVFQEILAVEFVERNKYKILFNEPFDSHLLNAQYRDLMYTKLPRVLRFNDHSTMKYGRELRLPYLDHRIVEFCFWLDPKFKLNKNGQKVLVREVMKEHLPKVLRGKSKKAFGAVQTEWFRKYFKNQILEILESESFKSRPYWNHEVLNKKVREFFDGIGDNSFFIWQCLNLELWFRKYIDNHQSDTIHQNFDSKWKKIIGNKKFPKYEEFSIFVQPGKKPVTQRQFNLFSYYEFIRKVIENKGYTSAIEIGCGRGTMGLYLSLYQKLKVICCDSEQSAIDLAKGNFVHFNATADFLLADAGKLPLKDNSLDVSVTIGLLEHLENYDAVLSEQFRILKPGGTIIYLNIPKKFSIQKLNNVYRKFFGFLFPNYPLKPDYFRNTDKPEQYADRAREAGFTDVYTININPFPIITPLSPFFERFLTYTYRLIVFLRKIFMKYPFKTNYSLSQAHFLVGFKK